MKNTRFVVFTVALAMMLMGAGYAAWTETGTITNTADTGELRVEFVDDCDHPRMIASQYMDYGITHGAKVTTVKMKNMYPGSTAYYETHIENLGSIPAELNDVTVSFADGSSTILKDKIRVWGMVVKWRPGLDGGPDQEVESKYIRNVPLKDLESSLETALRGFELQPGEYITFDVTDENFKQELAANLSDYDPNSDSCLFFELPGCDNVGNETENQCAQFDIKIDFKQWNK